MGRRLAAVCSEYRPPRDAVKTRGSVSALRVRVKIELARSGAPEHSLRAAALASAP